MSSTGAFLSRRLLQPPTPCYPSKNPDYHAAYPIGWNLYRCSTCAARIEPERLYHRIGWWLTRGRYNPFGRHPYENRRPF